MHMRFIITFIFIYHCFISTVYSQDCFTCAEAPAGVIFCDDFESTTPFTNRYFEYNNDNGSFLQMDNVGRDGSRGMKVVWHPNQVSAGNLKKSFGKTPDGYIGNNAVQPNANFTEIYWRIDLRMQQGWVGGGADKLSRITCLANSNWAQGMIGHVWSSGENNEYLAIDPATGIDTEGNLASTTFNDFENLRWLGLKVGNIDLFSTQNSGKWYCVEAHVKLNTSGNKDGVFELWINDTLQAGSYDLDWHNTWNSNPANPTINAIFLENYWNDGSPVLQERYMDNFVISTKRIGCSCQNSSSINDNKLDDEIQVFPNPSLHYFNVKVGREVAIYGYSIEFFDSNGISIFKTKQLKKILYSHNFQNLSAGNYYYRITSNSKQIKSGTFVIQN